MQLAEEENSGRTDVRRRGSIPSRNCLGQQAWVPACSTLPNLHFVYQGDSVMWVIRRRELDTYLLTERIGERRPAGMVAREEYKSLVDSEGICKGSKDPTRRWHASLLLDSSLSPPPLSSQAALISLRERTPLLRREPPRLPPSSGATQGAREDALVPRINLETQEC